MAKQLAIHETLEVHEVLIFKTACLAKNKLFVDMVQDKKLKEIIEEDTELSTKAVKDLRKILADASKQSSGEEA
ncbi:spore coat protein [Planomicrobium sp. CPCC 101110]|uniref:spore coat protein n=1 Tax=Planomicrobium sp. CPCC 101110 TaxID=2599619 RepID=UPI0011B583CC|nr:spore coat protein [Planomicrobium sp. CPCC 101110]TWT25114.1 spore coat protein [Planomicrobium sp. CPCC 101110]